VDSLIIFGNRKCFSGQKGLETSPYKMLNFNPLFGVGVKIDLAVTEEKR
jgi:hypothetical protein